MSTDNPAQIGLSPLNWGSIKTIAAELAKSELFRDAPESLLFSVIEQTQPRDLVAGEILLSPENENNYVYVLISGRLALHFESPDAPEVRELDPGVSVGEMSLIDETPPSAYVIAKQDSRVLPIHRSLLFNLISGANVVSRNLLRLLTGWLKANTAHMVRDQQRIRELAACADMDSQTGLYNRRWLDNSFPRLIADHIEGGSPLSLLLLDIDFFKNYNDTQGHQAGDSALISLSNVLRSCLRPEDCAARYGGDEFVILLRHLAKPEAFALAEKIRQTVESRAVICANGSSLPHITVSIGMVMCTARSTPETLMALADAQLYHAKAEGRNRVSR